MSALGANRTRRDGGNDVNDPFRSLLSKYYRNAQGDFPSCLGRRLTHVLQWVETFRGALEGGVIFGFGLLWPGHTGVTMGIQNTRQHRCIDDGVNHQRVGAATNGNLRDRQSVRG